MRTIKMFVSVMISGLIVRCCAVPTSDDVQLRLRVAFPANRRPTGRTSRFIRTYTPLYGAIHSYTPLYNAIHCDTFLYSWQILQKHTHQ
ncbi:hypothetical protein BTHE_2017 [Bifidobacterium thermophilum]|nr:hypothetical protein BTHE_2017 [Bifidobacterium thermophilum]